MSLYELGDKSSQFFNKPPQYQGKIKGSRTSIEHRIGTLAFPQTEAALSLVK
jgi:hypothetical protein